MARIGWLGLGAMGALMAARLAHAGYDVAGYDLSTDRVTALIPLGVRAAASAAAAADGADVVAVMVATPAQALDALFGRDGAATTIAPSAVVLVMSTIGPEAVIDIATRLRVSGAGVVDAPVSGGVARAADGDLLFIVSGDPVSVAATRPCIDMMASHVAHVGTRVGDGQRVKLVNQLLCGVHIAAAAEALAFAEALGLDPQACWETMRRGAAASFMLDDRGPRMLGQQPAGVKSAINIFVKDMGMVVDAARHNAFDLPLAATAEQLYLSAARAGFGAYDDSFLIEVLRGHASGS